MSIMHNSSSNPLKLKIYIYTHRIQCGALWKELEISVVSNRPSFHLWKAQVLAGREEKMRQLEGQVARLGEDGLGVSEPSGQRLRDSAPCYCEI